MWFKPLTYMETPLNVMSIMSILVIEPLKKVSLKVIGYPSKSIVRKLIKFSGCKSIKCQV